MIGDCGFVASGGAAAAGSVQEARIAPAIMKMHVTRNPGADSVRSCMPTTFRSGSGVQIVALKDVLEGHPQGPYSSAHSLALRDVSALRCRASCAKR